MNTKYVKVAEKIMKEKNFIKEQDDLHKKHKDVDEDKVIIETSNSYKFTVNIIKSVFKLISEIMLVILASIGILTLIYPGTRRELYKILYEITMQIKDMI